MGWAFSPVGCCSGVAATADRKRGSRLRSTVTIVEDTEQSPADHVRWAADACTSFLRTTIDGDWTVAVPDLDWTVAEAVAHAAEGCLWYAIDLSARGRDLEGVEHRVAPDRPPGELVATVETYASIVVTIIGAAPPEARGFHPMGTADPSGFAAMACDELLIHTDDAARGLGLAFDPPTDLAEWVLRRLFPWVEVGSDPWGQLQWTNGRTAFDGQPRLERWRWHCAPLEEWDGTTPPSGR